MPKESCCRPYHWCCSGLDGQAETLPSVLQINCATQLEAEGRCFAYMSSGNSLKVNRRFGGEYRLNLQALITREGYQPDRMGYTTLYARRQNLPNHRGENLKSYGVCSYFVVH
jgi:hypothetical protein